MPLVVGLASALVLAACGKQEAAVPAAEMAPAAAAAPAATEVAAQPATAPVTTEAAAAPVAEPVKATEEKK